MRATKEIRWFFKDDKRHIYDLLKKWNMSAEDQERTDYYLKNFTGNGLNLKIRDNRLEVKRRTKNPIYGKLALNAEGQFEEWTKWSIDLKNFKALGIDRVDDPQHEWIPVQKNRLVLYFYKNDKQWIAEISQKNIDSGCQLEYTELKINNEKWFTFGLEWFGSEFIEMDAVVVSKIIGHAALKRSMSMGYADFLANHKKYKNASLENKNREALKKS